MKLRSYITFASHSITGAMAASGGALVATSPAAAQAVGALAGAGPTAIATYIAAGCLGIMAAAATIAGTLKAAQVWSGHASWAEAGTRLGIGLGLGFGTAAAVGFAG